MSYLKLLRRSKARRRESSHRDEAKQDLPESRCEVDGVPAVLPVSNADTKLLKEAGHKPKVSFGKRVIWERPDTGFYVSQEMALHLLDTRNIRNKSGANARR
jgi:hypothetical protein